MTSNRLKPAFTLIEILISLFVFVIFVTIATNAYIQIMRGQRDANDLRRTYSEIRTMLDLVGEESRLKMVDYDYYDENPVLLSADGMTSVLALVDRDKSQRVLFRFAEDQGKRRLQIKKQQKNEGLWLDMSGYVGFKDLNSDKTLLDNVKFAIYPTKPPLKNVVFDVYQFHPSVTALVTFAKNKRVQNTFSSRVYGSS